MVSDELKQKVKEQIGYINAFHRGLFDVIDEAQVDAPPGWRVTTDRWSIDPLSEHAVRLGQVRVHHGDPEFKIFAIPHWLHVSGAVEFYGINEKTLTLALRQGKIEGADKHGKWRFPLLAMLEWDATRQRGPGQPRKG